MRGRDSRDKGGERMGDRGRDRKGDRKCMRETIVKFSFTHTS